jgi:hypothetical protein
MPDVPTLLEHARGEARAGKSFLGFRLDFLDDPCAAARASGNFVEEFPGCLVLATRRRHKTAPAS